MSIRGRIVLGTAATALAAACLTTLAPAASATTPSATTAPAAPSAGAAACDRAPWQPRVQGRPKAYHAGAESGDYLWHNSKGFHLRVTHRNSDRAVYTGKIASTAPMRLDPVQLEARDAVALSADRKTLYFRFYNHGRTDGINFHTDCARTLEVSWLHRGGKRLVSSHVFLGRHSVHPKHVPFTVHRG